jgi:hypothetical protein
MKSVTEMLLFLYRLLNSLGEVNLERSSSLRLVLFRHRNYLEIIAERISQEDHLDRGTYEPLKEFHFLKGKFDDAYLQKELQPTSAPTSLSCQRLQELANQPFTDGKATELHCIVSLEVANECENKLMSAIDDI